jgi:hypothetical protein
MDCGLPNPLYPLHRALGYAICSRTRISRLAGRAREGEGVEAVETDTIKKPCAVILHRANCLDLITIILR